MGDYFDNTVGKRLSRGRARLKLKPEAREKVKAQHGITDEELDAALAKVEGEITDVIHEDMKMLRERTAKQNKDNWTALREQRERIRVRRKKGEADGKGT